MNWLSAQKESWEINRAEKKVAQRAVRGAGIFLCVKLLGATTVIEIFYQAVRCENTHLSAGLASEYGWLTP